MRLDTLILAGLLLGACARITDEERSERFDIDGDGIPWPTDCDDRDPTVKGASSWYPDLDGDGFGDAAGIAEQCTQPAGHIATAGDCDDADGAVHPAAVETCNGTDDDCDGAVDAADPGLVPDVWYLDGDGDGSGDPTQTQEACAAPAGHVADGGDCDDSDPARGPDATERCNGVDDDCDGATDEDDAIDAPYWFADGDGDSFGDPMSAGRACAQPTGMVANAADCADGNPAIHPAAQEVCDGVDNNCSTKVDDADPWVTGQSEWWEDRDGDGYGTGFVRVFACVPPPGFAPDVGDCNDDEPLVHPTAPEVCNGVDDDCDAEIDDADADLDRSSAPVSTRDADGDGFGNGVTPGPRRCEPAPGFAQPGGDCDDTRSWVFPGAAELCDGLDNDCDTLVDEDTPTLWFRDVDGDGHGDPMDTMLSCLLVLPGYVPYGDDCDDGDPGSFPGAPEVCDAVDNDCDGVQDDVDPDVLGSTWHDDGDGDGFGDPNDTVIACLRPAGRVADGTDCDDTRAAMYPGAPELCDGLDNDCDTMIDDDDLDSPASGTAWFEDGDLDGFGDADGVPIEQCNTIAGRVADATDCDDGDATVYPGAPEVCDLQDNDCDTLIDEGTPITWWRDGDGDGYGNASDATVDCFQPPGFVPDATDCADDAPAVHPGALEVCNGIDDNCDLAVDEAELGIGACTPDTGDTGDTGADPETADTGLEAPTGDTAEPSTGETGTIVVLSTADTGLEATGDTGAAATADTGACAVQVTWYGDGDHDGYGNAALSQTVSACAPPGYGWVLDASDCDDGDPAVNPLGNEAPGNEIDEDCTGTLLCWADADLDAYGDDGGATVLSVDLTCATLDGEAVVQGDCDDGDPDVNPLGTEAPGNEIDEDCTGTLLCWADTDLDAYGDDGGATVLSGDLTCATLDGEAVVQGDCDDGDPDVNPLGTEAPGNEIDEDCTGTLLCWADTDLDAYGDDGGATVLSGDLTCATLDGEAVVQGDCDDGDPAVNPLGTEAPGNEIDEDCTGTLLCWADADGDGYGDDGGATVLSGDLTCATLDGEAVVQGDCDDADPTTYPGATDVCFDGADNDCDGVLEPACRQVGSLDLSTVGTYVRREFPGDDEAGWSVARAGDGDGDGTEDLLVGAPKINGSDDGRTYLVEGPVTGVVDLALAPVRITGGGVESLGYAVAGGGDVDGDGVPDALIGGPLHDLVWSDGGRAYLVLGPVTSTLASNADTVLSASQDDDRTGQAVAIVGDTNGDGLADLLVGSPRFDASGAGSDDRKGVAHLILGPASASGSAAAVASASMVGELRQDEAASSVAGAGDVDGDGHADLLIGAWRSDRIGGESGVAYLVTDPGTGSWELGLADAIFDAETGGDRVGEAVSGAGDTNGDGYDDVWIGAPRDDTSGGSSGAAYLVLGPATGTIGLGLADAKFVGPGGSLAGSSLAAGDADGDGRADALIGAPEEDTNGGKSGAAYLLYGPVSGLVLDTAADAVFYGIGGNHHVGRAVAMADADGDGFQDVVLGAWGDGFDQAVFVVPMGAGL